MDLERRGVFVGCLFEAPCRAGAGQTMALCSNGDLRPEKQTKNEEDLRLREGEQMDGFPKGSPPHTKYVLRAHCFSFTCFGSFDMHAHSWPKN